MGAPEVRGSITLSQGEFATVGMLHAHAVQIAQEEFAKAVAGPREPFQCPFLWLVKTPRVLLTIETPWSNDDEKIRSMQMMRLYMKMANATAYSFMHEAWMAMFNADNMPKRMPYSVRAMPADQREDVLMVWTFDRSDKHMETRWGVKRAGTPRAKLLAQDDVVPGADDHFEGRLFNLLKPPRPMSSRPGDPIQESGSGLGDEVEFAVMCPHCGKQHEMASVVDHPKATPKDDDVILCVECGKWGKIARTAPGGSRKLTEAESFGLGFDPRMRDVRRAWMEARKELDRKAKEASS